MFTTTVFLAATIAANMVSTVGLAGARQVSGTLDRAPAAGDPLSLDPRLPAPPGCRKRPLEQGRGNVIECEGGIL